jgi:hypothetical protein
MGFSRCVARGRAVGSNDLLYAVERLFANPWLACRQAIISPSAELLFQSGLHVNRSGV